MLVSPAQNSGVGGLDQRKAQTRKFCVAVEYRLNSPLEYVPTGSNKLVNPEPGNAQVYYTLMIRVNPQSANDRCTTSYSGPHLYSVRAFRAI